MNKNNALKIVLGIYALCVLILLIYSSIIGFESSGDLFSMGQLILEASLIPIAVYGFTYAVEEFKKSLERPELSLLFLDDSGNESKKITLSSDLPEHNNIEEYPRFKIPIYLKNSGDIVAIWYSIRLSIPLELLGTLHTEILNSKSLIRKLGFDNKLGSTQNWSSNESDGILDVRFESKGEIASYPDQELLLGVIDFSVSPNDKKYGGRFPLRYTIYTDKGISSWERGTNENTNGLLRQYFPKGSDFSKITDEKVQFAQKRLNQRPRKCLNVRTPEMVFFKISEVALTT